MEELFPKLSELLRNAVEIIENENELVIQLKVKKQDFIPGDLGSPNEIREMIRIFGGVSQKIPLEIKVNENSKIVLLKLQNKEEYEIIRNALQSIWERAAELLQRAFNAEPGKTEEFRALGDFDESY